MLSLAPIVAASFFEKKDIADSGREFPKTVKSPASNKKKNRLN